MLRDGVHLPRWLVHLRDRGIRKHASEEDSHYEDPGNELWEALY